MLERNNGITIRASHVHQVDGQTLELDSASIVNGCQTTMCIVARRDQVTPDLMVAIKIVESDDLWEVAHSANYQNRVRQIDLDLAKYLRPQVVQKAAARLGVALQPDPAHGVTDLIATISDTQVTYDETKALYKGVFSERPTNILDNNYSKLLTPVLDVIYETEDRSQEVFDCLFALSGACRRGIEEGGRIYAEAEGRHFQRFRRPAYSAYIGLLAAGAVTSVNLAQRVPSPSQEAERLVDFLRAAKEAIRDHEDEFVQAYLTAYEILSEKGFTAITDQSGDALISQVLYSRITQTPYETYYNMLRMRLQREKARRERASRS